MNLAFHFFSAVTLIFLIYQQIHHKRLVIFLKYAFCDEHFFIVSYHRIFLLRFCQALTIPFFCSKKNKSLAQQLVKIKVKKLFDCHKSFIITKIDLDSSYNQMELSLKKCYLLDQKDKTDWEDQLSQSLGIKTLITKGQP